MELSINKVPTPHVGSIITKFSRVSFVKYPSLAMSLNSISNIGSDISYEKVIVPDILELLVSEALYQVQTGANREITQAQELYNQQLAELQKSQNKEDDNG